MEDRVKKTLENSKTGCNCAQAVLLAFCDLFGLDEDQAFRLSEGFGRGTGDMSGLCGALSGALMVVGLAESSGREKHDSKTRTYAAGQEIMAKFREKNGAVLCKDLKGIDTGLMLRSCPRCMEDAARLLEEYLADAK